VVNEFDKEVAMPTADHIVDCWAAEYKEGESLDSNESEGLLELIVENRNEKDRITDYESEPTSIESSSSPASSSSSSNPSTSSSSESESSTSSSSSSSSSSSDSASPSDKEAYANYYYGTDDFQPNKIDRSIHGYLYYEYHDDASCKSPVTHVLGQAAGPCYPGSGTNSYRYSFSKVDCSDLRLSVYNDTQCSSFVQSLRVKRVPSCHKNQLSEHYLAYKSLRCSLGNTVPHPIKGIQLQSHIGDSTCQNSPAHLFETIPTAQCLYAFDTVSMVYTCDADSNKYARSLYIGTHATSSGLTSELQMSAFSSFASQGLGNCGGFHDTKFSPLNTCKLQVLPGVSKLQSMSSFSTKHMLPQGPGNPPQSLNNNRNDIDKMAKQPDIYQRLFCDDFRPFAGESGSNDNTNNNHNKWPNQDKDHPAQASSPMGLNGAFGMGRRGVWIAVVFLVLCGIVLIVSFVLGCRRWQKDNNYHLVHNGSRHISKNGNQKKSKKKSKQSPQSEIEMRRTHSTSMDSADSSEGRGFAHDHYGDEESAADDSNQKRTAKEEDRSEDEAHEEEEWDYQDDNAYTVNYRPAMAEEEQLDSDDDEEEDAEDEKGRVGEV
jgi:hypothetical protein